MVEMLVYWMKHSTCVLSKLLIQDVAMWILLHLVQLTSYLVQELGLLIYEDREEICAFLLL